MMSGPTNALLTTEEEKQTNLKSTISKQEVKQEQSSNIHKKKKTVVIHAQTPLRSSEEDIETFEPKNNNSNANHQNSNTTEPEQVHLTLRLHGLLDSQNIPVDETHTIIDGSFNAVIHAASEEILHHKKSEVKISKGEDLYHLASKEKPNDFDDLSTSEKNELMLNKQGALESQGGKLKKKNKFS